MVPKFLYVRENTFRVPRAVRILALLCVHVIIGDIGACGKLVFNQLQV